MQVGFGCYSNRSDSVPGQHQSVTDRVRVIAASGQTSRAVKLSSLLDFVPHHVFQFLASDDSGSIIDSLFFFCSGNQTLAAIETASADQQR
ncbi:hypothetical protein GQ457_09G011330 [Hibiscus cannabinus]